MLISQMTLILNKLVSNYSSVPLTYEKLEFYLDSSIDYINENLGTSFKTIKEEYEASEYYNVDTAPIPTSSYSYTGIPEKYIRSILLYKTAALFLEEEDETEDQYKIYNSRAERALINWRKEGYSCLDITDSNYDYEILKPYTDALDDSKRFEEAKENLIEEYEDYISTLTGDE
jgi:hypothetical protein